MGHTTKSARFTGLLGLLVIGGLIGLTGTGVAVESTSQQAQDGSAHNSGLQPQPALALANRSAATGAALLEAPVLSGAGHPDGIAGIRFELGRDQVQLDAPGEPGAEGFGELHRLAFNVSRAGWQERRRLSIIPDGPL